MLIFVKLGGSLITDKCEEMLFRAERMSGLARAISEARATDPARRFLLGHGSGSFGHFAAHRFGTIQGVRTAEQWRGFAEVSRTAAQLNRLVTDALAGAGVPVLTFQPSASAACVDGRLHHLETRPLEIALEQGLVPLVYGDVAVDAVRGGTIISTETIFFYLAPRLCPEHIFLLGEVPGVLDDSGAVIPLITPERLPAVAVSLGGSAGVDVTGGMTSKVCDMVALAESNPGLQIHICAGTDPEAVREMLLHPEGAPGTVIRGA